MLTLILASSLLGAAPEAYAIVVGNNQSPSLDRPQLRYADDDAVRTAEVISAALSPAHVELLTELDDDSAQLFPRVVAQALPPTRAEVEAAFARMEVWAKARHAAGAKTRGYFVFAGHGDIDHGEGFLELKDGRLTGADMERLLKSSSADELHVVLDSCNSWFVLSPRKAGGRQFPTPAEATRALAERLPKVGVLLSTSAEADVYEWSELQSGVFSYALRSGLIGAADANGDGDVSYEELAAFIDLATKGIKNPALRPKIFARGPSGNVAAGFAALSDSGGTVLTATTDAPLRLRFRDGVGIRWFDVHLAPGSSMTLHLPTALPENLVLQRSVANGWASFELPRGIARLDLTAVTTPVEQARSRGSNDALSELFSAPFGAQSVTDWVKADEATEQTQALGVGSATISRVGFFLRTAANRDRSTRYTQIAVGLPISLAGTIMAIGATQTRDQSTQLMFAVLGAGIGVEGLVLAGFGLVRSPWELEADRFSARLAQGDATGAVVSVDEFLQQRLHTYAAAKMINRVTGGVSLGLGITSAIVFAVGFPDVSGNARWAMWVASGTAAALGAGMLISSFWARAPEQDLFDAIHEERSAAPVSVGVSFVPGGAGISITGQF